MKQRGRSAESLGRLEHPRAILRFDLKAQLLEDASHGACVFAQTLDAAKGHARTAESAHLQPSYGVAFRGR